jgi:predicted nucleic acid-binding protein
VIGGRVLDTSALLAFARGTSIYASAAVWTAVEESIVLVVPSTAVASAWAELAVEHRPVLDVLLRLPITVIDALNESRARTVGQLGGPQTDAHAIACAQERGWPLLTAHPDRYTPYQQVGGVDLEVLP